MVADRNARLADLGFLFLQVEHFVKQLTVDPGTSVPVTPGPSSPSAPSASPAPEPSPPSSLPAVTRFRDPDLPYQDLITCERDCMRCSYAATLDCDGNCGACPRQTYCPCVNPAKLRSKPISLEIELPVVNLGRD